MTRAVTRSFQLVGVLANSHVPLTAAELAARTGLARIATQRLLTSLAQDGYIRRDDSDATYRPTERLWELAAAIVNGIPVRETALPHMIELAALLHAWVTLAFLEGDISAFTDRIEAIGERISPHIVNVRVHALTNASGRALAAFQPPDVIARLTANVPQLTPHTLTDPAALNEELRVVRDRGYAFVARTYDENVTGFGFPIFDERGVAVAAIGVPMWTDPTEGIANRVIAGGMRAAGRISAALGYRHRHGMPIT